MPLVRTTAPRFTAGQEAAARWLAESIATRRFNTALLFGVTASGKTEVYLDAIGRTLWRMAVSFRSRSEEFAYWVAAAASFLPISQVFPFLIPVADRYLYFILPGLIGAGACIAVAVERRLAAGPWLGRVAIAGGVAVVGLFAVTSAQRAKLWTNETFLLLDAARAVAPRLVVADSRIASLAVDGFEHFADLEARTFPNLGEFDEFRTVHFFRFGF